MGFLSRLFGIRPQQEPTVTAVIQIPQAGFPSTRCVPEGAQAHDLGLMALCYAAKIGWLVENETEVKPIFTDLAAEAASVGGSDLRADDFLSLLATAKDVRANLQDGTRAVAGGEIFTIEFYRKAWTEPGGSPREMGAVVNHLAQPGLAVNIPWSAFLLQDAVWRKLDVPQRERTVRCWDTLTKLLAHDGTIPVGDPRHLQLLFTLVSADWINVAA